MRDLAGASPRPRSRAGATPASARAQLVATIAGMAPAMRRLFDVRPSPGERARWRSLTVHQLEALAVLQQGFLTMGELCQRLDIAESAGTALIDRLVARGVVARTADDADRRVVRLSLSRDARAMVERFQGLKRRRIAEVLDGLDDKDLASLVRIQEQLLGGATRAHSGAPTTTPGSRRR